MLLPEESKRYHRHLLLPEIGEKGQLLLKNASVLVIGAGGLGTPVLQYLSAAGIGRIGIVEFDTVSLSNLQRQILYTEAEVGKPKLEVILPKLKLLNPYTIFEGHAVKLDKENVLDIFSSYQLIVDCSDNFSTRYLVNDASVMLDKTLVFGAIYRFEGQVTVFNHLQANGERSATYRCLFPDMPSQEQHPACDVAGVLGMVAGMIGILQASEVVKIICQAGEVLCNQLFIMDVLSMQSRKIRYRKSNHFQKIHSLDQFDSTPKKEKDSPKEITVQEWEGMVSKENWQLIDVREPFEHEICDLGGILMPLGRIDSFADQISREKKVLLYCHHGMRSANAIQYLENKYGFNNLYNLKGGIHAWAEEIDPNMEQY